MPENSVHIPKGGLDLLSSQRLMEGGRTKISSFKLESDELHNLLKLKYVSRA